MYCISGRQINFKKVEIVLFSAFSDTHFQRKNSENSISKHQKMASSFYQFGALPYVCITFSILQNAKWLDSML